MGAEAFLQDLNPLAQHYSHFRVGERLLLTGHSHQAWPDCAREGQIQAWDDAAREVDEKWRRAFDMAERVRRGYAGLLSDGGPDGGLYALGANTHELLVRFLSALPLRQRPRLVTTDGEFHTIRRQLARLEEEGLDIQRVGAGKGAAGAAESLVERLVAAVDDGTAAVLVSAVLFQDARIVNGFKPLAEACQRVGAELLVDAYHAVNVVPLSLPAVGLEDAFLVGGGYKYCQLGEGNCFLRIPRHRSRKFRPIVTGWFSEFSALAEENRAGEVAYGQGVDRWAGSTYDPTSHYRAAAVFDFFEQQGMEPELLREVSQAQIHILRQTLEGLDLPPTFLRPTWEGPPEGIGGFLALRSPQAQGLQEALQQRGVQTDCRGDILRLGPAPYLNPRQLRDAVGLLGEAARSLL